MEIVELGSGVRVFMYKEDKFNSCGVAVLLRRRLTREAVTANALLVNVMGLGCRKYRSPAELNRAAGRLFGGCFDCVNMKKGNWQIMEFYAETVNEGENVRNAVKFLGDLVLKPLTEGEGFKAEYVEREKQALKAVISSVKDNKKDYAKRRLEEKMFKGEGLGIYGDGYIEDVDKITPEGLYGHYMDIIGSSAVDIIAVGNFDEDELSEAFKGLNLKGRRTEFENKKEFKKKDTSYITEKMNITQGKLCVGIRTKADYYALLTANEIFGGGANSRLFMKAREGESLCYYISSNVVRCNGAVIVQSGISSENVRRVNDMIFDELKSFESVTEKEIEGAKESIIKRYIAAEDNLSVLSDFCLNNALYGGAADPREAAEKIKAAESDKIRKAFADAYIDTIYFLKEGGKDVENIF